LQVIEMIGKENVNIDAAQMTRIVELLRKETDVQERLEATSTAPAAAAETKAGSAVKTPAPKQSSPQAVTVPTTSQLDAFIPPPAHTTVGKTVSVHPGPPTGPKVV
jgi:hypothetical protein